MKSVLLKTAAVLLASVLLLAAVASGLGIIFLSEYDMYRQTPEQAQQSYLETVTWSMAYYEAEEYLAKWFGDLQAEEAWMLDEPSVPNMVSSLVVSIEPPVFVSESTSSTMEDQGDVIVFCHVLREVEYPCVWVSGQTQPDGAMGTPLYMTQRWAIVNNVQTRYNLQYYQWTEQPILVTVILRVEENPWQDLADLAYTLRYHLPLICVASLLLWALCMVYLCWAAGKKKGREEVRPGGLNRLPLDLYAVAGGFLGCFCLMLLFEGVPSLIASQWDHMALLCAALALYGVCLIVVCYVFCFAAQVKVKGFWWRHSVIGFCLLRIFRVIRWCWRGLKAVLRMLPTIWQWLLTAALMVLVPFSWLICVYNARYSGIQGFYMLMFVGSLAADVVLVLYGGWCFGTILKAAKAMARGDLERKINTKYLIGAFKDCAKNLNTVSGAAMVAAREQMKSERMKTELIANVSHDIKTPLTSLINYVDLLQKPHTEEENAQYLEVLARQSQRLKKLTEDLVEMSKASTGNVTVNLGTVDAGEAVMQALGEFGDKLEAVPLSVVFPQPQAPVLIRADGRLAWRVMSNVLGNAVKYAMPGTRFYVNVEPAGEWVRISFKNISRESLNISADELMERFVRGDASRNTEGSGLGLNIARSLMEVQGGTLELTVDGDLFKLTLTFPSA